MRQHHWRWYPTDPWASKHFSALLPSCLSLGEDADANCSAIRCLLGGARTWLFSSVRNIFMGGLFGFICLTPGMRLSNKAHCNHAIHYYLALLGSRVQRSLQSWKVSLPSYGNWSMEITAFSSTNTIPSATPVILCNPAETNSSAKGKLLWRVAEKSSLKGYESIMHKVWTPQNSPTATDNTTEE